MEGSEDAAGKLVLGSGVRDDNNAREEMFGYTRRSLRSTLLDMIVSVFGSGC